MSALPTIDPLKVAQRSIQKLEAGLKESQNNETHLEILAEALRDERDELDTKLTEALSKLAGLETTALDPTQVENITTLP